MNKRSVFLIFCICVVFNFSSCGCNNGGSEDPPTEEAPPKKEEMPDLVSTPMSAGKIQITLKNVRINTDDDDWLDQLGIEKDGGKVAVVNAIHPKLKMGDGIDKGLSIWAMVEHIKTPWSNNPKVILLKNYENAERWPTGRLSGLDVPFGFIFLVQGPNPECTAGLEESSKAVEDLYYDMLNSTPNSIRKIVLCAASTGKLAADGTTIGTHKPFTKAQWIRHIYNGMHRGINRYKAEHPNRILEIVLNNWNPK